MLKLKEESYGSNLAILTFASHNHITLE